MQLTLFLSLILFLSSCSSFSTLEPSPKLSNEEKGYIEIKDDAENFELEKGSKYVILFPTEKKENTSLVLKVAKKDKLHYYFTNQFNDGKDLGALIENETAENDSLIVYSIDKKATNYYWAIDEVKANFPLDLDYRYVPSWRFKFETSYEKLKSKINENRLAEDLYEDWTNRFNYQATDYEKELSELSKKADLHQSTLSQLSQISSLMPNSIDEEDPAYKAVLALKDDIKKEAKALQKHQRLMKAYNVLHDSERSSKAFVENLQAIADYSENQNDYEAKIRNQVNELIKKNLERSVDYYETQIKNKKTMSAFAIDLKSLNKVNQSVHSSARPKLQNLYHFFEAYNRLAPSYQAFENSYQSILNEAFVSGDWPSKSFYVQKKSRLSQLSENLNQINIKALDRYRNEASVKSLRSAVLRLKNRLDKSVSDHGRAASLVKELDRLRVDKRYSEMIAEILRNKDIPFLKRDYSNLDRLSLNHQKALIQNRVDRQEFKAAEDALKIFDADQSFLNPQSIGSQKKLSINSLEQHLFQTVLNRSKAQADSMMKASMTRVDAVEEIYNDAAFKTAYQLSFSTKGQIIVNDRNAQIEAYLRGVKKNFFPSKAIEAIYKSFIASPHQNGVAKARAVVIHGKHYKGKNALLWNMVNECDPLRGKKLSKTGQYRKVYALPKLNSSSSKNVYSFKMNIKIPSDSKFPAYEINIKLPESVAKDAAKNQWFDRIRLNGKEIRPEGRISITAPTKANDYEFQISPVQVKKDANNSFEVEFSNPEFKVYELSVMAQKPLIKKN